MLVTTYSADAYNTNEIEVLAHQLGLETHSGEGVLTVYFDDEHTRERFDNTVIQPWKTVR